MWAGFAPVPLSQLKLRHLLAYVSHACGRGTGAKPVLSYERMARVRGVARAQAQSHAPHHECVCTSQGKATAEAAPPPDTCSPCRWQGSRQSSSHERNVTSHGKATTEQFYILAYGLHARGNGTGAKPARITSTASRIRAWQGHRRKASHITSMVLQAGPA